MWSLPDINRLNANAAVNAKRLQREACSRRKPNCEHWNCEENATVSHLTYDIFSDDPKGVLHLRERHDGYSGDPMEGYFTCQNCYQVMVENYTWELYHTWSDGQKICLKCTVYARRRQCPKNRCSANERQRPWCDYSRGRNFLRLKDDKSATTGCSCQASRRPTTFLVSASNPVFCPGQHTGPPMRPHSAFGSIDSSPAHHWKPMLHLQNVAAW